VGTVVTLKGSLLAGPPRASGSAFPAGLVTIAFELTPPNKAADVQVHQTRDVNSPGSYTTLSGCGASDTVTQGTFLWVQTEGKMKIRITQNGDSGSEVSVLEVQGVYCQEFPVGNYLTLVEAQGVGTVEYFVSGTQ
jgi:hypothetical protein